MKINFEKQETPPTFFSRVREKPRRKREPAASAVPTGRISYFSKQGTPLQFLSRFLLVFLPLYALIELSTIYYSNNFLTQIIATTQSQILNAIGINVIQIGNILTTKNATFEIIPDCTGFMLIAMLAALLYATRSVTNEYKLNVLLLGGAALLIFNLIRLATTIYIFVNFGQTVFEITHLLLWIIDSLIVLAIWYYSISDNLKNQPIRY